MIMVDGIFVGFCESQAQRGAFHPRGRGGGNSIYHATGTCHFARKIGTHNSLNSGGF